MGDRLTGTSLLNFQNNRFIRLLSFSSIIIIWSFTGQGAAAYCCLLPTRRLGRFHNNRSASLLTREYIDLPNLAHCYKADS